MIAFIWNFQLCRASWVGGGHDSIHLELSGFQGLDAVIARGIIGFRLLDSSPSQLAMSIRWVTLLTLWILVLRGTPGLPRPPLEQLPVADVEAHLEVLV